MPFRWSLVDPRGWICCLQVLISDQLVYLRDWFCSGLMQKLPWRNCASQVSFPVASILIYRRQCLMRAGWDRVSDKWWWDTGEEEGHLRCGWEAAEEWGQTAFALLIVSPCQTIFKQNLLMLSGLACVSSYPSVFPYPFSFFISVIYMSQLPFFVALPLKFPDKCPLQVGFQTATVLQVISWEH